MGGQCGADARPVTVDEVEHAGGNACGVEDLGHDGGGERCHLGGLEHHGAAGGQRRGDLAHDLVERPVPRRDEAADADRLLDDAVSAAVLAEGEAGQLGGGGHQVAEADRHLRGVGEADGGAHLLGDRGGEVTHAVLILGDDPVDDLEALLDGGLTPGLEGASGGFHCGVDIGSASDRDLPGGLLRGRVDHVDDVELGGFHPLAVDVELGDVRHIASVVALM